MCDDEGVPVLDADGVSVREDDGVPVWDDEGVPVCEHDGVAVADDDGVRVAETEAAADRVADSVALELPKQLDDGDAGAELDNDGVVGGVPLALDVKREMVADCDALVDASGDCVADIDAVTSMWVSVGDGYTVHDGVVVHVIVGVGVAVCDTVPALVVVRLVVPVVCDAVMGGVIDAELDADCVTLADCDALTDDGGVGDCDTGVCVEDGVSDGDAD